MHTTEPSSIAEPALETSSSRSTYKNSVNQEEPKSECSEFCHDCWTCACCRGGGGGMSATDRTQLESLIAVLTCNLLVTLP